MKKVLILQLRPEEVPVQNEFEAFLKYSKLDKEEVERVMLTKINPKKQDEWLYLGFPKDLKLEDYSCIILGGGPQNISYPEEKKQNNQKALEKDLFSLLDKVVKNDFPFLGACLGIGLVVSHQKGLLSNKYSEEVAPIDISITPEGKKDDLLKNLPNIFKAYVGHKEACEKLPPNAVLLASGKNCPNQMFRVKENIYATQFHPELDVEGIKVRVKAYDGMGYFKPGEGEKIINDSNKVDIKDVGLILENFINKYHRQ